jgi:NADH-quinone oxidoreductase subunit N
MRLEMIDFAAISPLLILLFGALALLLLESFAEPYAKKWSFYLAYASILGAIFAAWAAPQSSNPALSDWLRFDFAARCFSILFLLIGLASILLSAAFFQRFEASHGEYYFLLLSAIFGLILIGSAADFLTLFLGLETLSIALYILCGYMKKWGISHESSMKYFLMGAIAAAILLYGIALIYGAVGTTRFNALLAGYRSISSVTDQTLFLAGIALVTVGLAFKAACVPFHVWAPDVYEGAPTPVTAFMSVGTKAGAFAAFAVLFLLALPQFNPVWNQVIALLAYPTLIYANLVALRQTQMRRFFAYSGISHAGFLLIPLAASVTDSLPALVFYLIVYALATLGCFAVLAFLDDQERGVSFQDVNGLFYRSPVLASIFALCLLTLAGIPPTAGFFAKFYIFKTAFEAGYYGLLIVGLLTTILSAFYYLRIIAIMFTGEPAREKAPAYLWPAALVGSIASASILALSFFPAPLLNLLASLTRSLN